MKKKDLATNNENSENVNCSAYILRKETGTGEDGIFQPVKMVFVRT